MNMKAGCWVAVGATLLMNGLHAGGGSPTLIAWNNLGMHCMDDDYSVFTILPPFNTVDAHYIDTAGHLLRAANGIHITYEAMADPDGSYNSTTVGKSNFWDFAQAAYGASPADEYGLAGTRMPGPANTPQPLTFDGTFNWFEGTGIPITPTDDAGRTNFYPMMRLVARDAGGQLLAETHIVLPVSGEMDCRACHASGAGPAAEPASGWVNDPNGKRDFRLNILKLHDQLHLGDPRYTDALAANGWPATGLYDAVTANGASILCAKCHLSEALPGTGIETIPPLTQAMHAGHAYAISPDNGLILNNAANRSGCYNCHPGSETRCLRGAMGAAVASDGSLAMQCQSCHGNMSAVGSNDRVGWFNEPTCQQCHTGTATSNNGQIRYTSVFEPDGTPRVAVNNRFATNPDTPVTGISLYRFSGGHGGLQCSACHGSTHAEFPASHRNDNLQSMALQGHAGVVADCTACHATMPSTVSNGPHGMHPVGQAWVNSHENYGKSSSCRECHGSDLRGTVLSRMFADRTLTPRADGASRTVELWRGQNVSCFVCHKREDNGSLGGLFTANHAPHVDNAVLVAAAGAPSASLTLASSDADGNSRTLRIVGQAQHGTVALNGTTATYYPEPGFAGWDSFTFAASDGFTESNLGIVSVSVGDDLDRRDTDGDGLLDVIEYTLGLSPDFPTIYTQPGVEQLGNQAVLTMSLPLGILPPDAHLVIEVSTDLAHWQPATILEQSSSGIKAGDPIHDVVAGTDRRFIRARVERVL